MVRHSKQVRFILWGQDVKVKRRSIRKDAGDGGGGCRVEIQWLIWGGQIGLILPLCQRTVSRLRHPRMRNNVHRPSISPKHHHPQHPRYPQPSQPTALSISVTVNSMRNCKPTNAFLELLVTHSGVIYPLSGLLYEPRVFAASCGEAER